MRLAFGSVLIAAAITTGFLSAQSTDRAFEVSSIKRNRTGAPGSETNTTPGRLSLINATMQSVILRAFGVLNQQVIGAPDWVRTERYDILAVTGDATGLTDEARQKYLQALLVDRCQLTFHRETRELRVYSLVSVKDGVKVASHTGPGEYAMRVQPTDDGRLRLSSTRGNMKRLTEILSGQVGELVADRTGLSGEYDFTLEWVPDMTATAAGPSLFTALTEQLGLKLDSAKSQVPVVVIDRIERPTGD
jgi:uncharacterized protein (TIGR03435 family)